MLLPAWEMTPGTFFHPNRILGILWPCARKPLGMLIPLATEICDSLAAKIRDVSLHPGLYGALAKCPKLLPVLLTVENCRLECVHIEVL